jgi:glucosyl-3-phosphoglycerate synthase
MSVRKTRTWHELRTLRHGDYPAARIAAERDCTVTVCLPARNEARTIGACVEALLPLVEQGAVDQLLVVDESTDGTAEIARALGAEVHTQSLLREEWGPVLGKGDAMWRALTVATGDVVCFLDADSEDLGAHFATGLIGPLVCDPGLDFVKGFYRRPFRVGEARMPEGGGRVTELMARPLLNAFHPELAGFEQPLAGEVAARRSLLERLPFTTGYGVDVGLLIDAWREVGLGALGQVDLDSRQNRHRPLPELTVMAAEVLSAVTSRLQREGRLLGEVEDTLLLPGPTGLVKRDVEAPERPPARAVGAFGS